LEPRETIRTTIQHLVVLGVQRVQGC